MKTKICKRCKEEKPLTEYHRNSKKNDSIHSDCNACRAAYAREYRQKNRDYVAKYKLAKGCELCGFETEHQCQLDLHHIDPSTKTYKGSSKSYDAGWSKKRIDAEIEKCLVVCKNCHSLENYRLGHWKNPVTDISMR